MKWWIFLPCATVVALLFPACQSEDNSIIDTSFNTTIPHLGGVTVSADTEDTGGLPPDAHAPDDSVTVHVTVVATLAKGTSAADIVAARVTVYNPDEIALQRPLLRNDGVAPDAVVGDSIFSGTINLSILRKQIGSYRFAVQVVNRDGNADVRSTSITLRNSSNHRPVLSGLDVPNTVHIPPPDSVYVYSFTVHVADAEGLDDVTRVSADVFDSLGIRKPITVDLFDDGDILVHGDSLALDGVYSARVKTDSTNKPGMSTFAFYAVDRSLGVSDSLRKVIFTR